MAARNDWRVNGAASLVADLGKAAVGLPVLMEAVVDGSAQALAAQARANATGRPGPEDATGDYVSSWTVEPLPSEDPTKVSFSAGTDAPQAHRLEFGFVGEDSLGRHYDAPPYPHMGPAKDMVEPLFMAAMEKVAEQAVRW